MEEYSRPFNNEQNCSVGSVFKLRDAITSKSHWGYPSNPTSNTHLTTFNVQTLKLMEFPHMLEHVLILKHNTQIDLLHDVLHTFFLYSSSRGYVTTLFGITILLFAIVRTDHAGFPNHLTDRADITTPLVEGLTAALLPINLKWNAYQDIICLRFDKSLQITCQPTRRNCLQAWLQCIQSLEGKVILLLVDLRVRWIRWGLRGCWHALLRWQGYRRRSHPRMLYLHVPLSFAM